jgi:predicted amidohydrolase YtcJ
VGRGQNQPSEAGGITGYQHSAETTAFVNGDFRTMDPTAPRASVVVCRGGRILAVGGRELEPSLPETAEVIDLEGRFALPGFVDAHCHAELSSVHLSHAVRCHTPPLTSIEQICQAVAEQVANVGAGEWVIGRGSFGLPAWVAEQRPLTRHDLDAVAPDNPVVVFAGLHNCTLNTPALRSTGLDRDPPPRGSSVDPTTGRATELWDKLDLPSFGIERCTAALERWLPELFVSKGITSIGEIVFTHDGLHAFQRLWRRGDLPLRAKLWLHVPRLSSIDDLVASGLESDFGDESLALGGIKLFVDGAGYDVWGNLEPSADRQWTQAELDEVVLTAHRAGLQLLLHVAPTHTGAIMAADALERAITAYPRSDHRHRIEHVGDMPIDEPLLRRLRSLAVGVLTTPQFLYSSAEDSVCPLASLLALGFRLPGNSDCTGTQPEGANPFFGIWCAVARKSKNGEVVLPEEAITVEQALRMCTLDAAYAAHMDDRGALAVGALADLAVVDRDPEQVPVDELADTRVAMTVVGGRVVWSLDQARATAGGRPA